MNLTQEPDELLSQFSLGERIISRIRLAFAFLLLLGMAIIWFFASYYLRNQEEQRFEGYLDVLSQSLTQPLQYFDLADIDATLQSYREFLEFDRIEVLDRYDFVQAEFGTYVGTREIDYQRSIMTEEQDIVGELKVWRGKSAKRPFGISAFVIGGTAQMLIIVIFGSTLMQFILRTELIEPLAMLTKSIKGDALDGVFRPSGHVLQRSELRKVATAYDNVTRQAKALLGERELLLGNLTEENTARKLQVRLFEEALQQSKMTLTYQNGASDPNTLSFGGWAPPRIRKLITAIAVDNNELRDIEAKHTVTIHNENADEISGMKSFETHLPNGEIWHIRTLKLEGNKFAIFASDETSKKQMEKALHQKNKLESLGSVSSGVAHDFNNILAIISTALEQISYDPSTSELAVQIASDAVERGASIVKQLLQFVHVNKTNPEICNLKDIFEKQGSLLTLLGDEIVLDIDINSSLFVIAEPNFLKTVFVNLIINARDALAGKAGVISITHRRPAREEVRANLLDPNLSYIAIDILDTGTGIPQDVLNKIFDPFFSTKPVGQGTGLGLSMAYEYLRRLGGTIYVSETSEKGTTISVILKQSGEVPFEKIEQTNREGSVMKQKNCLLVDDEEALVTFIQIYLERLGANVHVVTSVGEALKLIDEKQFDIVLSDMFMPDGTGMDILKVLRKKSGSTKFVLMSGNFQLSVEAGKDATDEGIKDLPFIEKPFKLHELNNLMEATLAS